MLTKPVLAHFQRREVPWDKVPFVPRPSLVPDPVTAFGKKRVTTQDKHILITRPLPKIQIKPKILIDPPKPYISARDATRNKVMSSLRKEFTQI